MKIKSFLFLLLIGATISFAVDYQASDRPQAEDLSNPIKIQARIASYLYDILHTGIPTTANPPAVTSDNDSTASSGTGANYVTFASHASKQVTVINTTGTSLDVAYVGSGNKVILPDGSGYTFRGLTNSNGLKFRRTDNQNTLVTVYWNWESF